DDLESALDLSLRGIAGAMDRGGERHGFAEFATIDLTAVQALDQIGDEAFHVRTPCPASPRRRSTSRLTAPAGESEAARRCPRRRRLGRAWIRGATARLNAFHPGGGMPHCGGPPCLIP